MALCLFLENNVNRETILNHWRPLRLRAIRVGKGLSLTDVSNRLNLAKAQILSWELGTKLKAYRDKDRIYQAYEITAEDLVPTEDEVNRMHALLTTYTPGEIQMAQDLLIADARCTKYDETRQRSIKKDQAIFRNVHAV